MGKANFPTPNEGKLYSPEEDAFITREYGNSETDEIAEALGRSPGAIKSRAMRIKVRFLKKPEVIPEGQKYCTHCETIFPLEDFFNHAGSKDGRYAHCKTCCKTVEREKRDKKRLDALMEDAEKVKEFMDEKKQEKNSKMIRCRICGEEKPGTAFGFTNNTCEKLDTRCSDCKLEINAKNKTKRIKDGRDW